MILNSSPVGPASIPTVVSSSTISSSTKPQPPERWSRYRMSPIARFDYGSVNRIPLWPDAWLSSVRGFTGAPRMAFTYGGATLDTAIQAAHALARDTVPVSFSFRNGRTRTTEVHPAIAVLRDAHAGAFWLAPLETTVQRGSEWLEAPHAIDGPAFLGSDALLGTPRVLAATRDLVAVVGAQTVVTPGRWPDAPSDSLID